MNLKAMLVFFCFLAGSGILTPFSVWGHCDAMDGPVVTAARHALDSGNVSLALIWVQKGEEAVIRESFTQTLAVRRLGPQARELADRHFFETLVRLHRAGEGAAFTGLKPAGSVPEPGIAAADQAIKKGSAGELYASLRKEMEEELQKRFDALMAAKNFGKNDVEGGRRYVRAYVEFIHFVERLFESIGSPAHGHFSQADHPTQR